MATGIVNPGDRFNNWTVIGLAGKDKSGGQIYKSRCICGTVRDVKKCNLGVVAGCGCKRKAYKARTKIKKNKDKKQAVIIKSNNAQPQSKKNDNAVYVQPTKTARQLIDEHKEQKLLERELSTF